LPEETKKKGPKNEVGKNEKLIEFGQQRNGEKEAYTHGKRFSGRWHEHASLSSLLLPITKLYK